MRPSSRTGASAPRPPALKISKHFLLITSHIYCPVHKQQESRKHSSGSGNAERSKDKKIKIKPVFFEEQQKNTNFAETKRNKK